MNKNFLKVLGLSALVGVIINSVYEIGIKEGKQQFAGEILDTLTGIKKGKEE